jgi:20S proteasome alpha/beta subunit
MIFPKPLPKPTPRPKDQRHPKRGKRMTLIAAFRSGNGGILLCADREESDGYAKRQIDKIFRINFPTCDFFIAGAGPSGVISRVNAEIADSLNQAFAKGVDLAREHKSLIESVLRFVHRQFAANLKGCSLGLIVVFVSNDQGRVPILYRTELAMLIPEPYYVAYGSGKTIADYLSDRLYGVADQIFGHEIDSKTLLAIALFIFRETEKSTDGVGLGADMYSIRMKNETSLQILLPDVVKELQEKIPTLSDAVFGYWKRRVKIPRILAE